MKLPFFQYSSGEMIPDSHDVLQPKNKQINRHYGEPDNQVRATKGALSIRRMKK